MGKVKAFLVGLIIGAVLCAVALACVFSGGNPFAKQSDSLSPTTVFDRIVAQNEMVSASQNYSIMDKVTDTNTFFDLFDIPFTENSFWYRYVGTVDAGVNLETAELAVDGQALTVTLDEPYIISNTPDMDQSGALEESNNILNPIHIEDVTAFEAQCKTQGEQKAIDGGLLDVAKTNAEQNITTMFTSALGEDYTVAFQYREQDGDPSTQGCDTGSSE